MPPILDQRGRPGRFQFLGRMPSQCSRRGPEASEGPAAPTGDVAADGGQAYGWSLLRPRSFVLARALFSAVPLRESGFWQCGIAPLDFEDLRTTNVDPVNVVRAGYDQELLEEACLANFREILIARGDARLQLDRLLSPLGRDDAIQDPE